MTGYSVIAILALLLLLITWVLHRSYKKQTQEYCSQCAHCARVDHKPHKSRLVMKGNKSKLQQEIYVSTKIDARGIMLGSGKIKSSRSYHTSSTCPALRHVEQAYSVPLCRVCEPTDAI